MLGLRLSASNVSAGAVDYHPTDVGDGSVLSVREYFASEVSDY